MGKERPGDLLSEEMPASSTSLKRGTAFRGVEGGFKAWEKDFPGAENPFRERYEAQLAGEEALTQPLDSGSDLDS
jgi:hypothetical protein